MGIERYGETTVVFPAPLSCFDWQRGRRGRVEGSGPSIRKAIVITGPVRWDRGASERVHQCSCPRRGAQGWDWSSAWWTREGVGHSVGKEDPT